MHASTAVAEQTCSIPVQIQLERLAITHPAPTTLMHDCCKTIHACVYCSVSIAAAYVAFSRCAAFYKIHTERPKVRKFHGCVVTTT